MVFSSVVFLFVFFPLVACAYFLFAKKLPHRNLLLLISSLLFYAWGEPIYVVLMILSILINFKVAAIIDNIPKEQMKIRKALLAVSVSINLLFLLVFKYEYFIVDVLTSALPVRLQTMGFALPIGISFFTFQALSYVVDVYRGTTPVQKSLVNLGLYISFFPQLIAGPIVRYNTIAEQIEHREVTISHLGIGARRFIIGMAKKLIFANQFAIVAEASFAHADPSMSFAWLGAIAYTLQIYYDFSGYSDMAIGLGKIFGFTFLENFNYPYISKTVTEFWRRWHMSLGTWFRDYLYIPLGGSKVGKGRLIFNLFVVWLCTGIWHGAAWRFIFWGLMYFCALAFEKLLSIDKLTAKFLPFRIVYQVLTMLLVIFGWVIFGETGLSTGAMHLLAMLNPANLDSSLSLDTMMYLDMFSVLFVIAAILATPLLPKVLSAVQSKLSNRALLVWDVLATCVYMLLFFLSVSYLAMGAHNPFIYFNF